MPIIKHLFIQDYGAFVSKHQGRLRVTVKGERKLDAPLLHLETLTLADHGVSISADAIAACARYGIPVHIVDSRGDPVASLYASALIGTVKTRRAQLLAYADERGFEAARALALGKIRNQTALLKYVAKYRKEKDPDRYRLLRDAAIETLAHEQELLALEASNIDQVREHILSAEGRAAKAYWAGVKVLVPEELNWPGRKGRHAEDPFNMAINYGYGVLYGEVERAIVLAGLDPYAGFLHTDRPGKPSLVLDLIEAFRAPVVDRTILAMVGKGAALTLDKRGNLDKTTRARIAEKIHARLDAPERYKGQRLSPRAILQTQARELASFLRRDADAFSSYQASW
ncbi:MAG TPA: CRISPR-associated endonuclease Cas1 [Anaerolineae bacterium]|nr:CRISPR-associated endonuclease Cas1 [Caldilineae bacterium]HID34819.1 CRISPR-associated endonuclease Cas1 [Anaerolineae bacterium]HIQ12582.1 CRISPR-associated endonuclease Cas1 [Caldilineales bacterium]